MRGSLRNHWGSENAKDTTCYDLLLWTEPVSLQKHNQSDCESRHTDTTSYFTSTSLIQTYEYLPSHQYIGCQLPHLQTIHDYTIYSMPQSAASHIPSNPIPSHLFLFVSLCYHWSRSMQEGHGTGNGKELTISLEEWIKMNWIDWDRKAFSGVKKDIEWSLSVKKICRMTIMTLLC